ncbi:hypothetical protein Rhe02_48830 [Rhizocola hellebori]|uniref:DUF559 domain-containing protein n=1 Tax=Rhizocola hellebori TaxID=1392758 RepID=A0A8J3QC83_9ACTN|nr:DUF559 domain-containing protein [Rhizocola hellebori]GIH06816.1 hypothetical protein Rhe02_48830 [Rhizocola hellebori]
MTEFWRQLPAGRAVRLADVEAQAVAAAMDPLPRDAPVVLTYYPHAETSVSRVVDAVLGELQDAATELFPSWIPEASTIRSAAGLGVPAIRILAKRAAATSEHYGPFLADLAEGVLRRDFAALTRFPRQTRAAGLARVLKNSYDRNDLALLVPVPAELSDSGQAALVSACEWIAQHGRMAIWLTGQSIAADRLATFPVSLPGHLPESPARATPEMLANPVGPVIVYPPIAGRPHHASAAEKRLEEALGRRAWAAGRVWNQAYSPHALVNPVRLDLWWRHERCVVEIDGPDHLDRWKYAQDRRRDVLLQSHGLTVLRFTNSDVLGDVDAVVAAIEKLLQTRRSQPGETHSYV